MERLSFDCDHDHDQSPTQNNNPTSSANNKCNNEDNYVDDDDDDCHNLNEIFINFINNYQNRKMIFIRRIDELENALRESVIIAAERENEFFVLEESKVDLDEKVKFRRGITF